MAGKMPIETMPTETKHKHLYWAVVEHYRTWLAFDGIERLRISREKNAIDAKSVRRIAIEYRINRGILATKNNKGNKIVGRDDHAQAIAEHLNQVVARDWPDSLTARAQKCIEIAEWARENEHTSGVLVSAATKLMWFLCPDGWTLFDRFAAKAVAAKGRNPSDQARDFFKILGERGFVESAGQINSILESSTLTSLSGERVIDKFLMLSGADKTWTERVINVCEPFTQLLPGATKIELEKLAQRISDNHAASLLSKRETHGA